MKIGVRKPSIKKSISARTTGKAKRKIKKLANPLYGKKGMGWIKNPKRALKNKIYRKTTISAKGLIGAIGMCFYYLFYWTFMLMWLVIKYTFLFMWWTCVLIINGIIALIGAVAGWTVVDATDESEGENVDSDVSK